MLCWKDFTETCVRTAPCSPQSFNAFSVVLPFRELKPLPFLLNSLFHPTSRRALSPGLGPNLWELPSSGAVPSSSFLPRGRGSTISSTFLPSGPGQVRPSPAAGAIHFPPPPSWLRRGARPSFLPSSFPLSAGRVSARPWAWLAAAARAGLGVSHSAGGAESRARRHTEAAGAGGCGAASGRGRLAAAPRPPTHTCCRAAVSWSAASSPAAADDLFARRQPLRSPGVPARAGDAPSVGRPQPRAARPPRSSLGRREPQPGRSRTMNPQCARCGKVVYPTEKVNCLDKYWHKGCFHCEVCKMALNMNNYKGYEKKPYCNAHYPKQSFTTVADTPENLRLKQQSELQSQVKYKRDFEESKGRGFSIVTDTPELQRLKRTQEQISNVKYHEDFEKTKGRGFTPVVDDPITERVRKNTQVVSDAAYKGVHPHIVEMDRRPGIIVAPVLPGAYQQSQSQGYGYMHQTSMSSMRSVHSQPHSAGLRTYRAMYDYSAQDEDEVSFRDGDYIINVQPIDDGWMYGTVQRTGKTGMLPANYIEFVN
uniref:Nebulette n=3 Tax=Phasianinae TaxID=9072 RepID=A0A669QX52_PHACC